MLQLNHDHENLQTFEQYSSEDFEEETFETIQEEKSESFSDN